jgi:hypothetical protein
MREMNVFQLDSKLEAELYERFTEAMNEINIDAMNDIIGEAQELNFADCASSMQSELDVFLLDCEDDYSSANLATLYV